MNTELQVQQNARRFASTAEQTVAYERHLGVRVAVGLLVAEHPAMAYDVLARSVERQARIEGLGLIHIEPAQEAS